MGFRPKTKILTEEEIIARGDEPHVGFQDALDLVQNFNDKNSALGVFTEQELKNIYVEFPHKSLEQQALVIAFALQRIRPLTHQALVRGRQRGSTGGVIIKYIFAAFVAMFIAQMIFTLTEHTGQTMASLGRGGNEIIKKTGIGMIEDAVGYLNGANELAEKQRLELIEHQKNRPWYGREEFSTLYLGGFLIFVILGGQIAFDNYIKRYGIESQQRAIENEFHKQIGIIRERTGQSNLLEDTAHQLREEKTITF